MSETRMTNLAPKVLELTPLGFDHDIFHIDLSYLEDHYSVACMLLSLDHHSWPVT